MTPMLLSILSASFVWLKLQILFVKIFFEAAGPALQNFYIDIQIASRILRIFGEGSELFQSLSLWHVPPALFKYVP